VVVTRALLLCDADKAVGGALIDFQLAEVCTAGSSRIATTEARSAIVSNLFLLGATHAIVLVLVLAWARAASTTVQDAAISFCLPSALLPLWTAVVPTTTAAAVQLFSHIDGSLCATTDVVVATAGSLVAVAPFVACCVGSLYWNSDEWICARRARGASQSGILRVLLRINERRWAWTARSRDASEQQLTPVWAVLLEYRLLWYVVLIAAIAVVSGLDGDATCRGWTTAALVVLLVQLAILCGAQPFTSIFSFLYATTTLSLTCASVAAQLAYIYVSSNSTSGLWLVEMSAVCELAVVGISAIKLLVDALSLLMALHRRLKLLVAVRRVRSANQQQQPLSPVSVGTLLQLAATDGGAAQSSGEISRQPSLASMLQFINDDGQEEDDNNIFTLTSPSHSFANRHSRSGSINLRKPSNNQLTRKKAFVGMDARTTRPLRDVDDAVGEFVEGLAFATKEVAKGSPH
jgi:hypothetical protein